MEEVFGKAFRILRWLVEQDLHGNLRVNFPCSLRKQPTFGDDTTGFPAKWRLRNKRRNSILMTRHYQDLGNLLIGRATWEIWFNQSQALPRSWEWRVVSLESLRSFIKRHLEGKPMEASPNVSCFFRPLSMFFLPFSPASFIESCSFWHGLKHLLTLHKLADKVILDR